MVAPSFDRLWIRALRLVCLSLALSLLLAAGPRSALAQVGTDEAQSGARGTIGGIFVGAETTMLIEGAFKVRPVWAYALGGGLGGVAGGIGGYFLDQAGSTPLSMTLLVTGLLLAVPTTIVVLNATSYRPPNIGSQGPESLSNPSRAASIHALPREQVGPLRTPSLAQYHRESLALGVPAVEISYVSPATGPRRGGVEAGTRVMVPIFSATF